MSTSLSSKYKRLRQKKKKNQAVTVKKLEMEGNIFPKNAEVQQV